MKNTVRYLIEPFLTQFFLVDAICRGFIDEDERKQVFEELAKVFCVPLNDETRLYYSAANSAQYKNIIDFSGYERLCRTIEFAEVSGQNVALSQVDRVVLAQKRESMKIKSEIFKQSKNLTSDIIVSTLLDTAMNGNVDAMAVLSYLEYHGICMCKDTRSALKRLALCAKWNNLFGNLMGIAYNARNKEQYYNTLYTVLRSSNQREVFKYICEFNGYEKNCTKSAVARIIEKTFGLGIIRRNVYDQIFAKVAFSDLISAEDKEKLLLNKKKDAIVSLSDIPFDVDRTKMFSFDQNKAQKLSVIRMAELKQIFCAISPAVNNRNALYQTLLVASDDAYIQEMYANSLKAGFSKKNKIIEIDAGTFSMQDFSGTKENFILRGLSETKESHTVFLLKHCEKIGEREREELYKLLDYEYRRKFKLSEPTVSLDLSDVLIVLFASEVNDEVRSLAKVCEVVWARKIDDVEKQTVIDSTFEARSKSFGIARAKMDEEGKHYLISFQTGQIIRIIDGALKKAAYENENLITAESLRTISAQQNIANGKREFGYLGGKFHEEY